jgi:Holliday junction DNA helicase RuvA
MIGSLEGTLEHIENGTLLVNVNGIGYEVNFPKNVVRLLPEIGQKLKIFTYLQVSETNQSLYGFLTMRQKHIFLQLISVSGVGPKTAMTILSDVEPDKLIKAIATSDTAFLSSLHGIGKKTAERIVIELKEKVRSLLGGTDIDAETGTSLAAPLSEAVHQDVTSALTTLGYNLREIKQALQKLHDINKDASAEEVIRQVLKFL